MAATTTSRPCRRWKPAATCWARSPSATRSARPRRWSPRRGEKGLCYGINLNHRFTPAARLAKRWQEEGRLGHLLFVNMSMWIMNPRESSPYFQIKALHPHTVDVMRYFCGDVEAVQCFADQGAGPQHLVHRHFQHALQERRGRHADRQLRHRARPPDGALRSGRHRRALRDRRHVARSDALSGGQPGEDGLHQPDLRRHARLRGHLPQPHPHASWSRWARASRRSRSTAPAPMGWPRRRCWPRRSSRWKARQSSITCD